MAQDPDDYDFDPDWNDDPSDEDAADVLGGGHPKCNRPPYCPGMGSAPGANGSPTTGPMGGQDSDF